MRELLVLGYGFLTLIICVQAMLSSSFRVGAEALAACGLNFAGLAIFFSSFLTGHEKGYSKRAVVEMAAIAPALVAAGAALMVWSGFWISLYGSGIPGPIWLLVGIVAALLWSLERKVRSGGL
jgi:hypothetical protein